MHIAFLTAEYPPFPGGVGDYTRCLARALALPACRVSVVTGTETATGMGTQTHSSPHPNAEGGEVREYRVISSWGWRCWRDTIATLDRLRPDILHIQYQTGAYGMHPAINLLPWRLQGLSGRPHTLVTFHDVLEPYLFPKAGQLRHRVTEWLAHWCDGVIVTNGDDAQQLSDVCQPVVIPIGSNIAVAPPPDYERSQWRARLGVRPDDTLIAYFGLLSQSKGADLLIDALAHLIRDNLHPLPCTLLLIGGAATTPADREYAARFFARIERAGLRERIVETGHVDAPAVSAHLLAADCVVLPFRQGASFRSGSLLAALSHGCTVITTTPPTRPDPTPPATHIPTGQHIHPRLVHNEHALLVPPGDSRALAAAIRRLAHDVPLRARLGQAARELAAHTGWNAIADMHKRVYGKLR